jgi:hypothetical protein
VAPASGSNEKKNKKANKKESSSSDESSSGDEKKATKKGNEKEPKKAPVKEEINLLELDAPKPAPTAATCFDFLGDVPQSQQVSGGTANLIDMLGRQS